MGVAVLFLTACGTKTKSKTEDCSPKIDTKVIGYVAGWTDMPMSKVDVTKLTHINYAFANIVDGKAKFMLETDSLYLATLTTARDSKNKNLQILYSIGGWVWSDQFSDMALSEESRSIFIKSAVDLMLKHKLDGVDLDWEYPGQLGEDNVFRPEDKENFTLLLKELREALDKQSKEDHRSCCSSYLLTIATGGDKAYIEHTNMGEAQKYLDFINIMTYDLYGGFDHQTGHHAALITSSKDEKAVSATAAVNGHINAGVPAEKIVLGVPFYGRKWSGVIKTETGLWTKAETVGTIISYKEIRTKRTAEHGYVELWDDESKVPYLWNKTEGEFISYETPKSMLLKIDYIKSKGLGGAMFWEYSDDYNDELINTISTLLE